jgi:hypothetical protein
MTRKRSTRMDTGRKRPTAKFARFGSYTAGWADRDVQARKQLARLRKKLRAEEARWDEKCPKGHLVRHDECDFILCSLAQIDPWPTEFTSLVPKGHSRAFMHKWPIDKLAVPVGVTQFWGSLGERYAALDVAFAVDKKIGWWWRVPFGWWLKLRKKVGVWKKQGRE